ncbi:Hypothetical protein SRAE_2000256200 [Strongyloides ratti]|uniref:Uncharacterized protein n=1 Tax=Strongyloides ratti TaxID=34506 RepID=A0A090LK32_STRRB|nr:Hypothetical protein SRAE_2000256200 [Strongyloides ratti]CEF67900.1 Hypothetical protein SRAE_2000256200 [Strongyloides ratti]
MDAFKNMKMNFHKDLKELQRHLNDNMSVNSSEVIEKVIDENEINKISIQSSDSVVHEPSECEKSLLESSLIYKNDDSKNQSLFSSSIRNEEENILAQFADLAIKSASRNVRESLAKNERLSLNTSETQFLTKMPPPTESPRESFGNIFQKSLNRSGMDSLFGFDISGMPEVNEMHKMFDDVSFNLSIDFDKSQKSCSGKIKSDNLIGGNTSNLDFNILENEQENGSVYPLDDETINLILQIFTTLLWEAFESNDENKIKNVPLKLDSDSDEDFSVYGDITRWLTLQFYKKRYSFSSYKQYFNKIIEDMNRLQNTDRYRPHGLQPSDVYADGTILDILAVDQVISEYSYNVLDMMNKGELDDFIKK